MTLPTQCAYRTLLDFHFEFFMLSTFLNTLCWCWQGKRLSRKIVLGRSALKLDQGGKRLPEVQAREVHCDFILRPSVNQESDW